MPKFRPTFCSFLLKFPSPKRSLIRSHYPTSFPTTHRTMSSSPESVNSQDSPQPTPTTSIISDFKDAVAGYEARANYACSGSIPIDLSGERNIGSFGASNGPITCPPITLRWDSHESGLVKRIRFPLEDGSEGALEGLLEDCAPATFGRSGKDVLDESYRKAGKRKWGFFLFVFGHAEE